MGLQRIIIDRLHGTTKKYDLNINAKKTKLMKISKNEED